MTDRLLSDVQPLLSPASLIQAPAILSDRSIIPAVPGIYGWWFDVPLPGVPIDNTLSIGSHRLLYVGIAPRKPTRDGRESKSELRKRICRNHLGRLIGTSTLRRSLAAILTDELQLHRFVDQAGRPRISREDEDKLTCWMACHAAVSLHPCPNAWEIEDALLANRHLKLPLNIKGAVHDFAGTLSRMRPAGRARSSTRKTLP